MSFIRNKTKWNVLIKEMNESRGIIHTVFLRSVKGQDELFVSPSKKHVTHVFRVFSINWFWNF